MLAGSPAGCQGAIAAGIAGNSIKIHEIMQKYQSTETHTELHTQILIHTVKHTYLYTERETHI